MKEVLIITGACGVGKSTLAKEWAKQKDGAVIECDYLTEWIYNKDFPRWEIGEEKFTAKLAARMAIEYLDFGMSTAIENVWTPIGIEIIKNELLSQGVGYLIKVVWLYCELPENHRRDELRSLEDQMKSRVDIVNDELRCISWPNYVHKIDTTKISVDQILAIVDDLE